MKKFFILLAAVVLTAISANVFAQGLQQTNTINSTQNYWVNSAAYGTAPTGHTGSTYQWSVYDWDGTVDYTSTGWTATAATSGTDYNFVSGSTAYNTQIKWLAGGYYVVEVVETNTGCTTVRRFGVRILDLDLLVVTKDTTSTQITADALWCNTNEGNIWGEGDDDDLNALSGVTPRMKTMTVTYEVSLYTVAGSTDANDLIGTALNTAKWRFTALDASTNPTAGSVTWTVSNGATYASVGDGSTTNNLIEVAAGVSTVTITAVMQNIADDAGENYELAFTIDPATVQVENGGSSATDYAEGQEPTANAGTNNGTGTGAYLNDAYKITVKPIPNTTKIKFD